MPARIEIEYTEHDLKELVLADLRKKLNDVDVKLQDIRIEVKSAQNYRAEWENARFRAIYASNKF